jgi:tetraacyldisaccharide 4'-kinase
MIGAPGFWRHDGILPHLLAPFGAVTASATARRVRQPGLSLGIPVICAGNAGAGGAGKTILVRHILTVLQARGRVPFALTRGYHGRLSGPVQVDPRRHGARDVGDEALLLAATAPTIMARDRAAGGRLAASLGARAVVMDDGLQNPRLIKTLSLLVVDGGAGFGNGRCLPAGPLREPVRVAAARCQAAVLIGDDRHGARSLLPPDLPVLTARLRPEPSVALAGKRVIGFAGIGRPEKFFASLRDAGAVLVRGIGFPDHHHYRARDCVKLLSLAQQEQAVLATTEKDAVKLPDEFMARCMVVGVHLEFTDPAVLEALLP